LITTTLPLKLPPRKFQAMRRLFTSKLALVAVLALALVAGAVAVAVSGGSSSKPRTVTILGSAHVVSAHRARAAARSLQGRTRSEHRRSGRNLVRAAARYLGLTVRQLRSELRSGKSLAQIARETPGKSEAGLVQAVLAAQRSALAAASERLSTHVKVQVQTPGGPVAQARLLSLRRAARTYLGLSSAQLLRDEHAGESLAQIARSTPGKSEAGLIEALVASRKQELEAAVRAGVLGASAEKARLAALQQRMTAYVHRVARVRGGRSTSGSAAS